jgi:hypothetical protein
MLVVINQVLWSENFVPIKDPINSSIPNLSYLILLTTCELKFMSLFGMHCIAYALGTFGILTCIRMKTPYSYSASLVGDVVIP